MAHASTDDAAERWKADSERVDGAKVELETPTSDVSATQALMRELAHAELAPAITQDERKESDESNDDALRREVPPHHGG